MADERAITLTNGVPQLARRGTDEPARDCQRRNECRCGSQTYPHHPQSGRGNASALGERQPVRKIICHVVAAERKHRERIAPQNTRLAKRRGRCF